MNGNGVVSSAAGATALVASPLVNGAGAVLYKRIPWREIAAWTHRLPKNATGIWMDVVEGAVRGPHHRWLRHHPVDFLAAKMAGEAGGGLSAWSYLAHAAADFVTVRGLPLLPESGHRLLVAVGVPARTLHAWTHLNLVDAALGSYSTATGGYAFFLASTGRLPWGWETFGVAVGGAVEMGLGVAMENPLPVLGGGLKVGAGAISLVRSLSAPEPTLWEKALPGLVGGLRTGAALAAARLVLEWDDSTPLEKAGIAVESLAVPALLGALSRISPWLSMPLGIAYAAARFAWKSGGKDGPRRHSGGGGGGARETGYEACAEYFEQPLPGEHQKHWPESAFGYEAFAEYFREPLKTPIF